MKNTGDKRNIKEETRKKRIEYLKKGKEKNSPDSEENRNKKAAKGSLNQQLVTNRTGRVTPAVQEAIREKLFGEDENGHAFITNYIYNFLDQAKQDPNSKASMQLASVIFNERLLTNLDSELNKQMDKDREFLSYRIRNTLYDKQQQVFDDHTSSVIECICTRRAGKTELLARLALNDAIKKGHRVLYINRSFDNAVRQMGTPLTNLIEQLNIVHEGSVGSGIVKFPQYESIIMMGGYNNRGDIDRYRGEKFSLILVDEVGHLRNPRSLVTEVLEPAMIDYGSEGKLIYTGTPPRTRISFAKELWDNPNITHYKWSFMDNPYIPEKDSVLKKVCSQHNCTEDALFIRREYFGDMDAFDLDAMFAKRVTIIDKLPNVTFKWAWVGVDWGFEDKAAVVSLVSDGKKLYVVDDWSEAKQPISVISLEIKRQFEELQKLALSRPPMIICDTNEKGAIADLYAQYKLLAYGAYKYDKDMALEQLSNWFSSGAIEVVKNAKSTIQDAENMVWKRDEETDLVTHELDDDTYHGNAMFAVLYVSRQYAFDVLGLVDRNAPARRVLGEEE